MMETAKIQEHFRAQTSNYPALMRRLIPFYDLQQDLIVSLIVNDGNPRLRILDLGCGSGELASRIMAAFPLAHFTLFDLTPDMIERCQVRFSGNPRVVFRVGDFRVDDFGTNYDVILASLSLHHAPIVERAALAGRLYESLALDGQLITAEVISDASPDVRERQYAIWRRFMDGQGEDGEAWYGKHLAKDHPVETSAWTRLLTDAGFVSAGCYWRYLNFAIFNAWRPA